jgi:hypothetical protein
MSYRLQYSYIHNNHEQVTKDMRPKICDVKDCLYNCTQVLVMHPCEMMKTMEPESQITLLCKFNPYEAEEDELHCILRFCGKHADEYRRLQENGSQEKGEMQFKEGRHKH